MPPICRDSVAAETRGEVEQLIRDGIRIYLEELAEDGLPIPEPTTTAAHISIAA